MIQKVRVDHSLERERILGDSVRSVAADLRLIDLPKPSSARLTKSDND